MKISTAIIVGALLAVSPQLARATEADDTTITITAQTDGVTPFIEQLTLTASDTSVIKSIAFTVTPKAGSVTRPLSGTYSYNYLIERGFLQPPVQEIFLPVYGLYDDFDNTVTLTYNFLDGSSKQDTTTITTPVFADPCGYKNPTVLQARTDTTSLSYDYIMIKDACSEFTPAIMDTDGALRWVGPGGFSQIASTFFDNAVYVTQGATLSRIDLDGTVTFIHDYSDLGAVFLHHNIDRGKVGMILDVNTPDFVESINYEVDKDGNVVKSWNLAPIISDAMIAGGDDPSQFVFPQNPDPNDWFHNNGTTYNRADDSLIISSRENFVICLDYETLAIKWILGDPTKHWHEFPSLVKYALDLGPDSLPPIGQHAPSITYDQNLLLFDNGYGSLGQTPPGETRQYATPRKYQLNLDAGGSGTGAPGVATEIWNYEQDRTILSPICGSIYEDAPLNYVLDYAFVGGFADPTPTAQILGLDAAGEKVFSYEWPTVFCNTAYNSIPLHLESTKFPTVGPQALNLSTRGNISKGDNVLIGGFIVSGTEDRKVALRVLGPSLSDLDVAGALANPVLNLYDSSGTVIATNDDWQSDPAAAELTGDGLAPTNSAEAATIQSLSPAAYTVVATGKNATTGVGLVEVYDLSAQSTSNLANLSTRGRHGHGDNALISGFIVGDVANTTVIVRALGPSLASADLTDFLDDPTITVYDSNGSIIAENDNWRDDASAADIEQLGIAPTDDFEAATILNLAAGAYSAVVQGSAGGTGISLIEVYALP